MSVAYIGYTFFELKFVFHSFVFLYNMYKTQCLSSYTIDFVNKTLI